MKNNPARIYEAIKNGEISAADDKATIKTREYLQWIESAQAVTSSQLESSGIRFKG